MVYITMVLKIKSKINSSFFFRSNFFAVLTARKFLSKLLVN